jgi:hypothetical protein
MVSNINTTVPADGVPADKSLIRQNFAYAKAEIEALQTLTNPAETPGTPTNIISAYRGMRNRLMNGAMLFGQLAYENEPVTGVVTINANECKFAADRWGVYNPTGSGCVFQSKVHMGTSGIAEFPNFLRVQATTARGTAWGDNQQCTVFQGIEGNHITDWQLGTGQAKALFLSFWVRSTIAGNFGASVRNARGAGYNYPFGFTINAANVWERKTVAIPAPTSGSWAQNTALGLMLAIDLGSSVAQRTTTEAWTATLYHGKTGAVSIGATLNAYIDLTGVQLSADTEDTPFDHRMLAQELVLCFRYAYALQQNLVLSSYAAVGNLAHLSFPFTVPMRATPATIVSLFGAPTNCTPDLSNIGPGGFTFRLTASAAGYYAASMSRGGFQAEYTT